MLSQSVRVQHWTKLFFQVLFPTFKMGIKDILPPLHNLKESYCLDTSTLPLTPNAPVTPSNKLIKAGPENMVIAWQIRGLCGCLGVYVAVTGLYGCYGVYVAVMGSIWMLRDVVCFFLWDEFLFWKKIIWKLKSSGPWFLTIVLHVQANEWVNYWNLASNKYRLECKLIQDTKVSIFRYSFGKVDKNLIKCIK